MQEEDTVEDTVENTPEKPPEYDELFALQQRCNMLGIKYHPRAGVDKLRIKIEAHQSKDTEGLDAQDIVKMKTSPGDVDALTHEDFMRETQQRARKNINRLVRVRVTCMNPNKTEWEGEIFSVGSAKLGTFKKFVPFGHVTHVPKIMYDHLKDRKYTHFYNAKGPRGEKIRKGRLQSEFAIETLDPLTPKELKELGQRQLIARSGDEN